MTDLIARLKSAEDRFLDKVSPEPNSGCWLWLGSMYSARKGQPLRANFWYKGTTMNAARASYMIFIGPIPKGLFVCHRCDLPACVNPDHLFLGTAVENAYDMISKGRAVWDRHPGLLQRAGKRNSWSRGANNSNAKLTADQVCAIRKDQRPTRAVAKDYNVDLTTIQRVKSGKTWASV